MKLGPPAGRESVGDPFGSHAELMLRNVRGVARIRLPRVGRIVLVGAAAPAVSRERVIFITPFACNEAFVDLESFDLVAQGVRLIGIAAGGTDLLGDFLHRQVDARPIRGMIKDLHRIGGGLYRVPLLGGPRRRGKPNPPILIGNVRAALSAATNDGAERCRSQSRAKDASHHGDVRSIVQKVNIVRANPIITP
jgi:hypothetical protein